VQDVGQWRALLGPAAAGGTRRQQVGRPVRGELGNHRLQVAADGFPEILDAYDLPFTVELDLDQDALDDPVDQLWKPCADRPGDLGDLRRQDDPRALCAVTRGRAHRRVRAGRPRQQCLPGRQA
jgi:hypothetical protein